MAQAKQMRKTSNVQRPTPNTQRGDLILQLGVECWALSVGRLLI
jgi:hypothetical protein